MSTPLTIGYIGLGLMGKSIARNILKAGFPLVVHNRSRQAVADLVGGGEGGDSSPQRRDGRRLSAAGAAARRPASPSERSTWRITPAMAWCPACSAISRGMAWQTRR